MRQLAAVHAQRAVVGAAGERRHGLAGIQQARGIEGALQRVEGLRARRRRTASTSARASRRRRRARRSRCRPTATQASRIVGAEAFGTLEFAVLAGVEQDQRVQVAVARVEDVGDVEADSVVRQRRDLRRARPPGVGAGSCRPCSSSRARADPRRGRPTCGPTTCAGAPSASAATRTLVAPAAVEHGACAAEFVVDVGGQSVELRRAAVPARPAGSRSARTPRPR